MSSGLEVLVPGDFNVTTDNEGRIFMHPKGNTSAVLSAVMPKDGYYFDAVMLQDPIDDETLKVDDNLEEFSIITDKELDFLKAQLPAHLESGRALLGVVSGAGLGDIALVPAPWMENPKGIRDIEEWYISTITRRDFLHELFDRQTDIALKSIQRLYGAVDNAIDAVWICGLILGPRHQHSTPWRPSMNCMHPTIEE